MRIEIAAAVGAAVLWAAASAGAQPAASSAPAAPPAEHVLKLTNTAKTAISAVYVAPKGSQDFSDDLLGRQVAGAGRTVTLKVKDPMGSCVFDFQFLMDDGALVTRSGVNLCQTSELSFSR